MTDPMLTSHPMQAEAELRDTAREVAAEALVPLDLADGATERDCAAVVVDALHDRGLLRPAVVYGVRWPGAGEPEVLGSREDAEHEIALWPEMRGVLVQRSAWTEVSTS